MIDFIREINYSDGTSSHSIDVQKLKEWADQKDRQIEELRLMVDRLAFKDVYRYDMNELHIDWKE